MRYALRSLARTPGFTAIAILTIAIGIGANTALFSIFHRLVLSPLDLPEPNRLVRLWSINPERNFRGPLMSVPKYELFAAQQESFSGFAASVFNGFALRRDDAEPEQLVALQSTASWIPTVGLTLLRGRNFTADEDRPGGPPVVILTEDCWRNRFGARETIVGESVALGESPRTVVGILRGPLPAPVSFVSLIVPRALEGNGGLTPDGIRNGASILQITARLKPGVTFQQAEAEMHALSQRYQNAYAANLDGSNRVELLTWVDEQVGNARSTLYVLLGAVALVLLIACANVSNLFLSRLTSQKNSLRAGFRLARTFRSMAPPSLSPSACRCSPAS